MKNQISSMSADKVETSVIVPCYNEENTISLLLGALFRQTYPISRFEVIIADGISTDLTRKRIVDFLKNHKSLKVKVVDNPKRTIPAAVNVAVQHSSGAYIVRLDAHSVPEPDYIELCVMVLKDRKADCVGGVWKIAPGGEGWMARSIAVAAANPIAVGDAHYRFTKKAAFVDTVPFGAFKKDLFIRLGGFNEELLSNEDYEFFTRIRKNSGRIWLDPAIRSTYFARKDLLSLSRQYWRYGFWKFKMLQQFPDTLRWRQALPPIFVLTIISLVFLSLFYKIFLWVLLGLLIFYFLILIVASLRTSVLRKDSSLIVGMPLAILCMHFSWGSGFLYSIIKR
jgi:succinoglycan biosynthesis protein ExoA